MADITFESPIPYESISQGRRREQALAGELAQNMMNTYFRAQAARAERENWAEELPLRNARMTLLSAQAANEKADGELQAISAASAARRRASYADLAALQEDAAADGWGQESEKKFYGFLARNPDFVGSKEAESVAQNFIKSRLLKERLDAAGIGSDEPPSIFTDEKTGARYVVGAKGGLHELPFSGAAEPMLDADGNPIPNYFTRGRQIIKVPSVKDVPASATPIVDKQGRVIPGKWSWGNKIISIDPLDLPEEFLKPSTNAVVGVDTNAVPVIAPSGVGTNAVPAIKPTFLFNPTNRTLTPKP